jgi:hypothetical protein
MNSSTDGLITNISRHTWDGLRARMSADRDRRAALNLCIHAGYRPLPWQQRFHVADGARAEELVGLDMSRLPQDYDHRLKMHKAAWCGLGAGKTYAFLWEIAILAILNPGVPGVVIAPTYDLLEQEILPRWALITSMLSASGYPLSRKFGKTNKTDYFHCGGKLVFRSATKIDNLRGIEFGYGAIDESEISANADAVWDIVSGRVRRPCPVPEIIVCSTPRGNRANVARFTLNRQLIRDKVGQCALLKNWFQIRATSEDNPHVDPGWLASCRATYSQRRWREEILAEILTPAAQVWSEFSEAKHRVWYSYNPNLPYDIAYDAGDQYPHVLFIQQDHTGRAVVFHELCPDNMPTEHFRDMIAAQVQRLGRPPENVVCDRAVKREIAWMQERFPRSYVHRMNSRLEQSVAEGIQTVQDCLDPLVGPPKLVFENRLWAQAPRRGIVRCMSNYSYHQTPTGEVTTHPKKDNVHDHGADAIRMWCVMHYSRHSTAYAVRRAHGSQQLQA